MTKQYYVYWKFQNREIPFSVAHGKKQLKIVLDYDKKHKGRTDLIIRDGKGNLIKVIKKVIR